MSGSSGYPIAPVTIEDHLDRLERRLNEAESRERGTGRRVWDLATIMVAGATVLDQGIPSWRRLNDGRIELRGRLNLTVPLTNKTTVLRLPGICSPPGNGAGLASWVSTLAPCATTGSNPGVIRIDVQRTILTEDFPIEGGGTVQHEVIYADVIALPPVDRPLTGWIGFDHVVFDPDLYLDILNPVPKSQHGATFGHGYEIEPNTWVVGEVPGEFGVAILGYENEQLVTIVPGMESTTVPPLSP